MKNGTYFKVLDSSVIKSVIYDKANSYLYVHFHTGSIWQYEDVGLEDYYDLITSKSAGVYFNKNIRNHYVCNKIGILLENDSRSSSVNNE